MTRVRVTLPFRAALLASALALSTAAAEPPTTADWRAFYEDPAFAPSAEDGPVTAAVPAPGGGSAVAFAPPEGEKRPRSRLVVRSTGAPDGVDLEIPGTVVALLFAPRGEILFAAIRRPALSKRAEPEVYLATIDLDSLDARRRLRLPTTTRDLTWLRRGEVLAIACRDEIRTLNRVDLRSGPLFPVPGENRALAPLGRSRLVVGQDDRWIVVDLEDRPDERSLPIRARGPLGSPPLAMRLDGEDLKILGSDATRTSVRLELPAPRAESSVPRRDSARPGAAEPDAPTEETDPATPVPAPPEPAATAPAPESAPDAANRPATTERGTRTPIRAPETGDGPVPGPPGGPVDRASGEADANATDRTETSGPASPETADPTAPEDAPPVAPASPDEAGPQAQLSGRLVGPAARRIQEIVLSGPDNLLRVAARAVPRADGVWKADGLAPGRYRVQADAGGDARAVTSPPFLVVEIVADGDPVRLPDWTVLRVD